MSAESSPQSGSSQSQPAGNSRYSRAGQTALQRGETELNRQRDKDRGALRAAQIQAQQDQAANARRLEKLAGRSNEIEEISALLGGKEVPDGRQLSENRREDLGSQSRATPPAREAGGESGKAPRDASAPPADDLADDEPDESREKSATALVDFASDHELDIDELYGLTVTTDDGESYSIGELKDGAKRLAELDSREADFEDQRESLWNEIAVKQQNVEALINRLKAYVPIDTLARAAVEAEGDPEENRQKSIQQLRQWFPEWKDAQVQRRDRERVETRLSDYGFTKYEVGALTDARIIRFLVETARKLERYDRLRRMPHDKIPTTQAPSQRAKPSRTTTTEDRARKQAESGDKIGAITTLLGG